MPPVKSTRLLQLRARQQHAASRAELNASTEARTAAPTPTTAESVSPTPTTAESVSPPTAPPPPLLSNTTTAQSVSPPTAPPLLSNTTTARSGSPPTAPPLLNTGLEHNSATATVDASPASLPLLSIRCKASGDGKKRLITTSNKTAMLMKSLGKKIRPEWSDHHNGPASQEHRSLLTHDIGAAVRTHVQMQASTFYELKASEKSAVERNGRSCQTTCKETRRTTCCLH